MRKYIVATLACLLLSGRQYVQAQLLSSRIDVNAQGITIKEVLQRIEKNNGIRFSYSDDIVPVENIIQCNLKRATLHEALDRIFSNTLIDYKEHDNQILLFRKRLNLDPSKRFTISGYIKEQGSSEPLTGVNIQRLHSTWGAATNASGYFSISMPSDTFFLKFSYVGFHSDSLFIVLDRDVTVSIFLQGAGMLNEVLVEDKGIGSANEMAGISKYVMPIRVIKEIPALLGEKDVFKTLRLMPGIQSGNEGQSGLYVRGGGQDQNLVLFDDAVVYNAFHLLGFFSLFNGDALRSVELTKGGFPAQYGGRLSAILDVNTRDGNKNEWHGEGGIGLISSRLTLEGPLIKNKASLLVSGRRTYFDQIIRPFFSSEQEPTLYFYDIIAKADWIISDKDKLQLSYFHGRDHYFMGSGDEQYNTRGGTNWRNITSSLRWNHVFGPRLYAKTALVFSNYDLNVIAGGVNNFKAYSQKVYSGITDIGVKSDFQYAVSSGQNLRFGLASTYHYFVPQGYYEYNQLYDLEIEGQASYRSVESAIYAEDQIRFGSKLNVLLGLRFAHFSAQKKSYLRAEPRVGVHYDLNKSNSLKANYTVMNQFVHLLSTTGIGLPTDLWVPSTPRIGPQQSQQWALAFVKKLKPTGTFLSVEGFYKHSTGVVSYKEGATFVALNDKGEPASVNWEEVITQGNGTSYGGELLLEKRVGKLTGWIGYTLSWAYLHFNELNRGERFFARHDRRHDVSVVGSYKINSHLNLSATWVFGTGQAITLPEGTFYAVAHKPGSGGFQSGLWGNSVTEFGQRNQYRMGDYHRLDIGVQIHWGGKKRINSLEFSIYNVYNRMNPYYYFISQAPDGTNRLKQMSLFPILPSIAYSIKF